MADDSVKKTTAKSGARKTASTAMTMRGGTKTRADHTGVYVNRNGFSGVAFITVIKPDQTCGMFFMPDAHHVIWMGYTNYYVADKMLMFEVRGVPDGQGGLRDPGPDDEKFVEASLEVGVKYTQGTGLFEYVSGDLNFWLRPENSWGKIGEAGLLEDMDKFDVIHAVKQAIVDAILKYGNTLGW